MEADIKVFDTVESTNITLEDMAKSGAPEGTCVVAFEQTAGQGRRGRSFYSPKGGNLYMSLLLRPKDKSVFGMITVYAAVATACAIENVLGVRCGIKWVNDIYLDGRKVSGIVAQAHDVGSGSEHVILGIGINIYEDDNIPADIADRYGSVIKGKCDRTDEEKRDQAIALAKRITDNFAYYYDGGRKAEAVKLYRSASVVTGKMVEYDRGKEVCTAYVAGIDDDGGIILEIDGIKKAYRDGEIRIRIM